MPKKNATIKEEETATENTTTLKLPIQGEGDYTEYHPVSISPKTLLERARHDLDIREDERLVAVTSRHIYEEGGHHWTLTFNNHSICYLATDDTYRNTIYTRCTTCKK